MGGPTKDLAGRAPALTETRACAAAAAADRPTRRTSVRGGRPTIPNPNLRRPPAAPAADICQSNPAPATGQFAATGAHPPLEFPTRSTDRPPDRIRPGRAKKVQSGRVSGWLKKKKFGTGRAPRGGTLNELAQGANLKGTEERELRQERQNEGH